MSALFRLFLLFTALSTQGCQQLPSYPFYKGDDAKAETEEAIYADQKHDQVHSLMRLGRQYSKLTKESKQDACTQLEQDYLHQNDWQSAWLLVYLLNDDFKCLSQTKTLKLLKAIQADTDFNVSLRWMNRNQIKLIDKLIALQAQNSKYKKKNSDLKNKLDEAEIQLQEVISKIQALKIIETTINQKTE